MTGPRAIGATSLARYLGAATIASGLLAASSCGSSAGVQVVLLDPCCGESTGSGDASTSLCFRDRATFTELAVFPAGCPADDELAAGDTSSAVFRKTVPAKDDPPTIGELKKEPHGFSVLMRDEQCRVMAFGCTAADLETIREIRIAVRAWLNDQDKNCQAMTGGGCGSGACIAGKCVSEGGAPDAATDGPPVEDVPPAVGCTLKVVAAGELPMPVSPDARLTGPGVVATESNFVIGYREMDASAGSWRVSLMTLSDGGTLGAPTQQMTTACAGMEPSDGFGMSYSMGQGMAGVSDPDCGGGAGATFIEFDAAAAVTDAKPSVGAGPDLTIAPIHSLGPGPSPGTWELVYKSLGKALSLKLIGTTGNDVVSLFNDSDIDFVQVAATNQVRATLTNIVGSGARMDIGPAGTTSPELVPFGAEGGAVTATWGAITAWADRAAAIVPAAAGGVELKVADRTGAEFGGGSIPGSAFRSGDIAQLRNHLFVVGGQMGGFTVFDVQGATTAPMVPPANSVQLTSNIMGVSVVAVDGNHVAIAAARQRVALAWLRQQQLVGASSPGGWALLECGE